MSLDERRMAIYQQKVLDGIIKHGHMVQGVPDADPPFAYTVGLSAGTGSDGKDLPELYMSGRVPPQVLGQLLNIAAARLKAGTLPLGHVEEIVQDFEVTVLAMTTEQCDAAEMNMASNLLGSITGLQIVLPDADGTLPGDPEWLNEVGASIHGSPIGVHCTKCLVPLSRGAEKALDGTYAEVWTSMEGWICPRDGDEHTPSPVTPIPRHTP